MKFRQRIAALVTYNSHITLRENVAITGLRPFEVVKELAVGRAD